MKTRTASSIELGVPLTGTTGLAVTAQPTNLLNIEGYCGGTASTIYFVQAHGVSNPTSGVTVPYWSKAITGGAGFSYVYPNGGVSTDNLTVPPNTTGIWFFISTTDTVFTSTAFNSDLEVDYEEYEQQVNNYLTVNDVTNVASVSVWADLVANASNEVISLTVKNTTGAAGFIMLFAASQGANGNIPIRQWPLAAGASMLLNFGDDGESIYSQDANATPHYGCYFYASSTTGTLTAVANGWNFTGIKYDTGTP